MSGYIRLHRKLLDSYQFSNPNYLKIWIWMLLKASHKPRVISLRVSRGYTDISIERGQFVFGRNKAKEELELDESMIYRVIKKLQKDGSIDIISNNQYSIITICKYDEYNSADEDAEQPMNNRRTTDEQPVNTDKNVKNFNKVKNNRGNKLPLTEKELALLKIVNEVTGRKYKTLVEKSRREFADILADGYNAKDVKKAVETALSEMTSREKQNYLTPEFICRPAEFQKYVNMQPIVKSEPEVPQIKVPTIDHNNRP